MGLTACRLFYLPNLRFGGRSLSHAKVDGCVPQSEDVNLSIDCESNPRLFRGFSHVMSSNLPALSSQVSRDPFLKCSSQILRGRAAPPCHCSCTGGSGCGRAGRARWCGRGDFREVSATLKDPLCNLALLSPRPGMQQGHAGAAAAGTGQYVGQEGLVRCRGGGLRHDSVATDDHGPGHLVTGSD